SLARAGARSGGREEAARRIAGLGGQSCVALFHLATAHAALGERDTAFRCLGESCAHGESWAGYLAVDPRLDSLRDDPRFAALVQRLRLPMPERRPGPAGHVETPGQIGGRGPLSAPGHDGAGRRPAGSLVVLPLENLSGDPA